MKRLLLVAEDSLILNYHRGCLEEMGLKVDTSRTLNGARKKAAEFKPDLVLLDPIMSGESPISVVQTLRAEAEGCELWVISDLPQAVGSALMKAGATRLVERDGSPGDNLYTKTSEALGMGTIISALDDGKQRAWIQMIAAAAAGTINSARVLLHDFVKDPRRGADLYELFRYVHVLSHRIAMLELHSLGRLTEAIDTLVFDLYAMPEQVNPSVVRTLGQTLDFMASLFANGQITRLHDPAAAEVCVVEDEAPSRQMIGAAMKMVGLKMTCADDHQTALDTLGTERFDLIFLDVNLPAGSGFDLCAKIRLLEDHKTTPIVFLTGMNTIHNRARGSLAGGNDFIGKPFNLLELGVKALIWLLKRQLATKTASEGSLALAGARAR